MNSIHAIRDKHIMIGVLEGVAIQASHDDLVKDVKIVTQIILGGEAELVSKSAVLDYVAG